MPARQPRPTRSQDPEYLAELGGVLLAMTDTQRREFLAGLDRDNLEVAERALAARIAVSWRATPVTMGVHFGALKPWRYSLLLGEKFADAVEGRSIRQIWNAPPQHGKSLVASQWGPAWALDRYPERRLILTSYGDDLASRNSYAVRQILREHRAEMHVRLRPDQQRQDRFSTPQGGGIMAAGIGSGLTGFGAHGAIVDDPFKNWIDAHSAARRELVWNQFRSVIRMRLTDEWAFLIVVQTRWHEDDLTARLVDAWQDGVGEEFEVVRLPELAEEADPTATNPILRLPDPIGRVPGEILEPERFSAEAVAGRKLAAGSYLWCTPAETPILMADWTELPISEVRAGDQVVGFECVPGHKLKLVITTVSAADCVGRRPVCDYTLASGRVIRATRDHRWFLRAGRPYSPARVGSPLRVLYPNDPRPSDAHMLLWSYLAGIIDGEGHLDRANINIAQTVGKNGPIVKRILQVLDELGLVYNARLESRPRPQDSDLLSINLNHAGRVLRMLLRYTPFAKRDQAVARLLAGAGGAERYRDRVLQITEGRAEPVYALETGTGNYVAWGLASANSSLHQQRPSPEEGTEIQRAWFRLDDAMPERFDDALVSWDPKLKDKEEGDYVVGQCWLRTGSDFWLVDQLRGQWNQATTINAIALMAVKHPDVRRHVIENTGNGPEVMTALRQAMPDYVLDPEMAGQLGMTSEEAAAVQALRRRGLPGLIASTPKGSKSVRMRAHAPLLEAGNVHVNARASWLGAFLDEMCVVGSTMVMTRYGLKRADEVSTADEILTHRGRFRPVEAVGARVADNVITVQAKGLDVLMLTDNHRVLTLPVSSAGSGRDLGEPQWREAGVLRRRQTRLTNRGQYEPTTAAFDTLTVPVLQNDVELVEIDLRAWFDLTSKDGRCYGVDDDGETISIQAARAQPLRYRQQLDHEFGWLCGLWLAEGSWSLGRAEWSFHEDETVLHEKVTSLLADRLGVRTSTFSPGNSRGLKVSASLRRLGAWFKTFGTGAANKRIPWWAWEAPASFHEGMIEGWLDGDGHDGRGTTVSRDLAWGMRLLATRQGIWARFVQREQRDDMVIRGKLTRAQRSWSVDVQPHGAVVGHWTDGDLIGLPIRQLDTRWLPPTTVFDIQVAEDSSFVTTGGIVHNSAFPNGSFDDAVDCASQALSRLSHGTASVASPASAPLPTGGPSVRTGARFGVIPGARVR